MRAEHIDAFVRATAEGLEGLNPRAVEFGPLTIRADLRPRRQLSLVAEVTGSVSGRIIYGFSLPAAQKIAAAQGTPAMLFDDAAANALTEWFNGIGTRAAAALGERGCTCEVAPPTLVRISDDPGDPHPGPAAQLSLRAGIGDVDIAAALSGEAAKQDAEGEQVVSQAELDALVAAIGREGAVEVSRYHFARPPGLAKPAREAMERRFDACARAWSTGLNQMLRAEAEVRWVETQLCPRADIGRHVLDGSVFGSFAVGGEAEFLLQLSPALAFYAIDRLLGGPGELVAEARLFTAIEKGLMETLVARLLEGYGRSGEEGASKPRLLDVYNQNELPHAADEQVPILLASFQVTIADMITSMSLVVPQRALTRAAASDDLEERIARVVAGIPVHCAARLAGIEVPLAQIGSLRPGDLFVLEVTPDDALDLVVDGQPRFRGTALSARDRLAVRVTGRAERTDAHD